MQPLQYYLRDPAAKDNSIAHAAAAPSKLDKATTMRSGEAELRNTIELHATALEIAAPQPDLDAKAKKDDFEALFKRIFKNKIASAKIEKKMLTNHCRSLHAATPIRFTKSSCKRQ